jgi:hypothetical protein
MENLNKTKYPFRFPIVLVVILDILTAGVFAAIWILIQRRRLNLLINKSIGIALPIFVIFFTILTIAGVPFMAYVAGILDLVLCFTIRSVLLYLAINNNVNDIRINIVYTFFLREIYLQYKLNKILSISKNTIQSIETNRIPLNKSNKFNSLAD